MIFLTGSTGFLGRELAARLLTLYPTEDVCLLARGDSESAARQRAVEAVTEACTAAGVTNFLSRISVVWGEVSKPQFGLGVTEFESLARKVTAVFHCAASTKFSSPLTEARGINVAGTRQALDLAKTAERLKSLNNSSLSPDRTDTPVRYHHVSTAYVAGKREAVVRPDELNFSPGFRNSYEQSKAEAEVLVRAESDTLSTTIYRPSVVVGDSRTGRTSAFNVIYMPSRLLISGVCKALPALPNTPFDVVPVNYIADAIAYLSLSSRSSGACYHLSAGLGRESSPLEIVTTLVAAFHRYKSTLPQHLHKNLLVAPELLIKAFGSISAAANSVKQIEKIVTEHISVFSQLLPFVPYMISNPRFDSSLTARDLEGSMQLPPLFEDYAETVFRYCFETNWGKRTPVGILPAR